MKIKMIGKFDVLYILQFVKKILKIIRKKDCFVFFQMNCLKLYKVYVMIKLYKMVSPKIKEKWRVAYTSTYKKDESSFN